jgi:membrane protease YdiL (CAAX protease family)
MSEHVPPRPELTRAIPPPPPYPFHPVEERPKATWRWWEALGVWVLAFFLSGVVAYPLLRVIRSEGLATIVVSAAVAITTVGALVLWLQGFHRGWRGAVGFPKRVWPEVGVGAAFGIPLYLAVVFVIGIILTLLLEAVTGKAVVTPQQVPSHLSAVGVLSTLVYGVVIAPIHEEFFFRGILYRGIRDRHGVWIGILGSSCAFGLIHYIGGPLIGNLLLMCTMAFAGAGLAFLYERRGNVVANMVAHATFNAVGLLLIFTLR